MKKLQFEETPLKGAWIVNPQSYADNRGKMVRLFCEQEFLEIGIEFDIKQSNVAINIHAGTLRGMHCQVDPVAKSKVVRCVRGRVYDVIVDMRPESETYLKHFSIELSAENMQMLVIPKNFYHGYLTLEENSDVLYMVDNFYTPEYGRGLRYNDPLLGIEWPMPVEHISEQDLKWPLLEKTTV